jgi:hypothetical protein
MIRDAALGASHALVAASADELARVLTEQVGTIYRKGKRFSRISATSGASDHRAEESNRYQS